MIAFALPYPPAVNGLYPTKANGGRRKSARYAAWTTEAGWMVPREAKGRITGPFHATLTYDRPDRRRRDLDGLCKAVFDLLTTMNVIPDDSLADKVTLAWSSPSAAPVYVKDARVHVEISPCK